MMMSEISEKIAKKIKTIRSARGWSLDKTAAATGVSKAMLGQIERGESSPTIALLWKIAAGLDVSFSFLVEGESAEVPSKAVHSFERSLIPIERENVIAQTLFPFEEDTQSEVFQIEVLPHSEHISGAHQSGVIEHVLVKTGTLMLLIGETWHRLEAGQGMRFSADCQHGYKNETDKPAVFFDVIHYL